MSMPIHVVLVEPQSPVLCNTAIHNAMATSQTMISNRFTLIGRNTYRTADHAASCPNRGSLTGRFIVTSQHPSPASSPQTSDPCLSLNAATGRHDKADRGALKPFPQDRTCRRGGTGRARISPCSKGPMKMPSVRGQQSCKFVLRMNKGNPLMSSPASAARDPERRTGWPRCGQAAVCLGATAATGAALQALSAGAFFGRRLLRAQRPEWP
jgi:hypothetical protein